MHVFPSAVPWPAPSSAQDSMHVFPFKNPVLHDVQLVAEPLHVSHLERSHGMQELPDK